MPAVQVYDVIVPFPLVQVEIGWRWAVAQASLDALSMGEASVTVHENRLLADGRTQYTRKTYDITGRLPKVVASLVPERYHYLDEESWNQFPYCHTALTNKSTSPEKFKITIDTEHLPFERAGERINGISSPTTIIRIPPPTGCTSKTCIRKVITIHAADLGPGPRSIVQNFVHSKQKKAFEHTYAMMASKYPEWSELTKEQLSVIESQTQARLATGKLIDI